MGVLITSAAALILIGAILYFAIRKDIPAIRRAWRALSPWERYALISGFILYLGLPVVQAAAAPKYLVDVSSKLVEAVGNGLFLLGLLSFLQKLHAPPDAGTAPTDGHPSAPQPPRPESGS